MGSASFVPSASHSRQRSPVLGASGKDAKFFNATSNLGVNISDKKHEILGGTGSFNISMNLIPMNGLQSQNEDFDVLQPQSTSHIVVKEEHNEEEDDEEETKCSAIPEVNLRVSPNDTTVASSNLNLSSAVCETPKLNPIEIRQMCKERMDETRK